MSNAPAQLPGEPDHIDAGKTERETEPGERVLQMVVRQAERQFARRWKPAGRYRRFLLDIEGGGAIPFLGGGDGGHVARVPDIVLRLVGGRESAARFRPAQHADNVSWAELRA